jgi:class 3 adenylate cyclase/pimeloyl-ACP methyl ester carboxylesterase
MFDPRGLGGSDSISYEGLSPWEQWADDVRTVLDAVGSERAALLGGGDTGAAAILFAATEPERTSALMLNTSSARFLAADDYPCGLPQDLLDDVTPRMVEVWGTEAIADVLTPTLAGDEAFRRWFAKTCRAVLSPRDAAKYFGVVQRMDVRQVLPSVRVPTLVIHCSDYSLIPLGMGQYLADHIPAAKFVVVPSDVGQIWAPSGVDMIVDEIAEFLTGTRPVVGADRILSAVLFTDIVGSTERAALLGDRRWRELLQSHDAIARAIVEQHRGRLVKTTGDGLLATFDGPGRAVRCAIALQEALHPLGITIRAGLHTGEIELLGEDIGGIGVHIAARVHEHAGSGELLVSAAIPLLVAGSGIEFEDHGEHQLKGVPGMWRLFAVKG